MQDETPSESVEIEQELVADFATSFPRCSTASSSASEGSAAGTANDARTLTVQPASSKPYFAGQSKRRRRRRIWYVTCSVVVAATLSIIILVVLLSATDSSSRNSTVTSPPQGSPSSSPPPPLPSFLDGEDETNRTVWIQSQSVVLEANQFLELGEFKTSPLGYFQVGLSMETGDLELQGISTDNIVIIWSARISNGHRCYLQPDGNLVIRNANLEALWTSKTDGHDFGTTFMINDGGQILIQQQHEDSDKTITPLWLSGLPRGEYTGSSPSSELQFPVRGAFYYPWYPETWTVGGKLAKFVPDLGLYKSSDPTVITSHLDALDYAHIDLSIASWWGPGTNLDRARQTLLMDETVKRNYPMKWTVYHEDERYEKPSVEQLKQDLDYLKYWFAWHVAWAHVDGKPVIFVYNAGGCEIAERWMEASGGDWHVVLKLFQGYTKCPIQPDSWHQYGVGEGILHYDSYSVTIAPGFWRADKATPRLPRLDATTWCQNVQAMVDSGEPWQLIVSFNEAGEGTMIESSPTWATKTGYGYYLDCLHNPTMPNDLV